jgi:hypothetical protein
LGLFQDRAPELGLLQDRALELGLPQVCFGEDGL